MTMSSDIGESFYDCNQKDAEESAFQKLQEARKRYIRNKCLHDILVDMIKGDLLEDNLCEKIKDILNFQDVLEGMSLDGDMLFLLGLKNHVTPSQLSFQEQCKVKSVFEQYVSDYYQNFQNNHADLMQANLSSNIHDRLIKDLKEKLNLKQQEDVERLTETSTNLNEIIKLRTEELSKILTRKLEEYELKMKIMHAKYKVLHYRLKMSIFTEVDKCFEAYQELIQDIQRQQEACRRNIEALNLQKEKYAVVQCKEFDSILETYLQYKCMIQEKKALLEKLQK